MAVFKVGRWSFPSKKSLLQRLQILLHQVPIGEPILGENSEILLALVKGHPRASQKIGVGISGFTVGHDSYGGTNFQIVRKDGSREPFSYRKTVSKYNPVADHRSRAKRAFRNEVWDQVEAVKRRAEGTECSVSRKPLVWDTTDIDHAGKGFNALLETFLSDHGLSLEAVAYSENPLGDIFHLEDRELASQWSEWHRARAVLVPLHRDAHRAKGGADILPLDETYLTGSKKR